MDENKYYVKRIRKSVDFIEGIIKNVPDIAIVSGSNTLNLENQLKNLIKINYSDIPNFPVSTVKGHDGYIIFGEYKRKSVAIFKGRFHYYEGYNMKEVTYYVRVLALLGTKYLVLTNAAGAVNSSFNPGDIMMIKDHVSFFLPECPLRGGNLKDFGERFPDMTEVYDKEMRHLVENIAQRNNIKLRNGIYIYIQGPKYETPFEVKILNFMKVDAVGMSTVPEAIVAKHCDMKVLAFSCITNMAAGITGNPLSHYEVIETGLGSSDMIAKILIETIAELKL